MRDAICPSDYARGNRARRRKGTSQQSVAPSTWRWGAHRRYGWIKSLQGEYEGAASAYAQALGALGYLGEDPDGGPEGVR